MAEMLLKREALYFNKSSMYSKRYTYMYDIWNFMNKFIWYAFEGRAMLNFFPVLIRNESCYDLVVGVNSPNDDSVCKFVHKK